MTSPVTTRRARVVGVVQGVGFRFHTAREAERLGVRGWVRNASDGSVEVHAEGPAGVVDDLLAWLRTGPPSASVDAVEVGEAAAEGAVSFEVRA